MDNLTVSVPTSIPESSTLAILGGIIAVLGAARRVRQGTLSCSAAIGQKIDNFVAEPPSAGNVR